MSDKKTGKQDSHSTNRLKTIHLPEGAKLLALVVENVVEDRINPFGDDTEFARVRRKLVEGGSQGDSSEAEVDSIIRDDDELYSGPHGPLYQLAKSLPPLETENVFQLVLQGTRKGVDNIYLPKPNKVRQELKPKDVEQLKLRLNELVSEPPHSSIGHIDLSCAIRETDFLKEAREVVRKQGKPKEDSQRKESLQLLSDTQIAVAEVLENLRQRIQAKVNSERNIFNLVLDVLEGTRCTNRETLRNLIETVNRLADVLDAQLFLKSEGFPRDEPVRLYVAGKKSNPQVTVRSKNNSTTFLAFPKIFANSRSAS